MKNGFKLISKEDSIFLAGHRGMAGKSIYKALKNNGYKNIIFVNRKELDLTVESDGNAMGQYQDGGVLEGDFIDGEF